MNDLRSDRERLAFTAPLKMLASEPDAPARTVDVVCSTSLVNDYGYRVSQDAWDLSRYEANPVVLYGHNSHVGLIDSHDPRYSLPIGRAENVRVEDGSLRCSIRFASAEANPLAEQVYRLMQEGILSAVSVGFDPIETSGDDDEGSDEAPVVTKAILYELSVVPIGADPGAVKEKRARVISHLNTLATPSRRRLKSMETDMPTDPNIKLAADDADKAPAETNDMEPDGDEPKAPVYAVGDAVMFDGRPAEVASVISEPCYALNFTDDEGGAAASVCESDLEPAESDGEQMADDDDDAEKKELRAQVRALKFQLASKQSAETKKRAADVVKLAKSERKITHASEPHLAALVGAIGGNQKAHSALVSFISAQPKIAALASKTMQPAMKKAAALSFNGKTYGDLSFAEKHELATADKDLFDAMRIAHEQHGA